MRAYEYVADKPTTIRDMTPVPAGTLYIPNFRLEAGDLFLVLLTPEKRLYFFPRRGAPRIQVPASTARAFLEGKCRVSAAGMRAAAEAAAHGLLIGDRVYVDREKTLENGARFAYCDGGTLILDQRGHLRVNTATNEMPKGTPYKAAPTAFDPEQDVALLESLLRAWDFMSEPTRFAAQRIWDRLAGHPRSLWWLERYHAVWKAHEKNPYAALKTASSGLRPLF